MKEKKYNLKNLYVGYIAHQSIPSIKYVGYHYALSETMQYSWNYTPLKLGLFIKTPLGYKHILTNTYYKTASYKTGGEIVMVKANTHTLTKFDPALCQKLISNKTPYLTTEHISKLENKYNVLFKDQQKDNEEEFEIV